MQLLRRDKTALHPPALFSKYISLFQLKPEPHPATSKGHHSHGGARLYNGGTEVAHSNGAVKRKSLPPHPHAPQGGGHHHASHAPMHAEGAMPSHHATGTSSSQRGPPPPYPHGRVSLPGYPVPLDHVAAAVAAAAGGESATPPAMSLTNWVQGQYPSKGHHHELPSSGHRGASTVHNYPYSHPPG